jgi:hypothetical protein
MEIPAFCDYFFNHSEFAGACQERQMPLRRHNLIGLRRKKAIKRSAALSLFFFHKYYSIKPANLPDWYFILLIG